MLLNLRQGYIPINALRTEKSQLKMHFTGLTNGRHGSASATGPQVLLGSVSAHGMQGEGLPAPRDLLDTGPGTAGGTERHPCLLRAGPF